MRRWIGYLYLQEFFFTHLSHRQRNKKVVTWVIIDLSSEQWAARGNRSSLFEKEINKKLFCGSPRRDREPNERGSEELERERMVSSHWEKRGAKQNRTERKREKWWMFPPSVWSLFGAFIYWYFATKIYLRRRLCNC